MSEIPDASSQEDREELAQAKNRKSKFWSTQPVTQFGLLFIHIVQNYRRILLIAGLPVTQGNSGNFQIIENLRETQGDSGKF